MVQRRILVRKRVGPFVEISKFRTRSGGVEFFVVDRTTGKTVGEYSNEAAAVKKAKSYAVAMSKKHATKGAKEPGLRRGLYETKFRYQPSYSSRTTPTNVGEQRRALSDALKKGKKS